MSAGEDGPLLEGAPELDAERIVAELHELAELTGGRTDGGARRVAWGPVWREAREWLTGKLDELGVAPEIDEAGNLWARLEGDSEGPALGIGSHIDSVPAGGWLDGALGVVGALGVLRAWAEAGVPPPRALTLIDFADEEGARFGRSLFGSAAVAGTLDAASAATLADAGGEKLPDVLAANGVELDRAGEASARLASIDAFLELHIEQGPVLEASGTSCAAVAGCVGVERFGLGFSGRASHSGTTPMELRRDAGLAAASVMLAAEQIAIDAGGVATTGRLELDPGIVTAVAGEAALEIDLRHEDAETLAAMQAAVRAVAAKVAADRDCTVAEREIFRIEPIPFDPDLVAVAALCCSRRGGAERPMRSGALHDAAEMARRVPVAMVFCSSTGGISHNKVEDTPEEHLLAAIRAYGELAAFALLR